MVTTPKASQTRSWREWVDPFLAVVAVLVSTVSLWVAIGTEQANRRMVAAASWPLLQVDTSDLNATITFSILNGGVGPAKLKTVEVFWNGKAFSGARALLKTCCGYQPARELAGTAVAGPTELTTGGVHNIVVRAGESHTFLAFPLRAGNVAVWRKLDRVRRQLTFRACYCSVFDECWIGTLQDLEPKRVDNCPAARELYVE